MTDFTDSALIGHVVSFALLGALAGRGIISREDVLELLDDALLILESHQAAFPDNAPSFEGARAFLSQAVASLPATSQTPPWHIP